MALCAEPPGAGSRLRSQYTSLVLKSPPISCGPVWHAASSITGLELLKALRGANSGVQMNIPEAQVSPRSANPCREGKTGAAARTQVTLLQAPDLHTANRITADNSEPLVMNAGSSSRKRFEVPQFTCQVPGGVGFPVFIDHFLEEKKDLRDAISEPCEAHT